ncbi:MAG TPA: molybdopterin cofactor-binding domain-containing protein [Terriglobales bacterium]|jgi:isoquinoline 1-oxidoreductase beta subunit|nr:molybdopterin cofactor-binding domain-containing protein [Terriglobales bacterium]
MSDNILNVSRRGFLQGMISTGALILSVRLVPDVLWAAEFDSATHADRATLHPSAFVGIDSDGTVYLVAHRSEMGTSSRTSVPLILADELDADWKRVKLEQAIGDPRYGDQDTDGSHSVRSFYQVMREAGATARLMLTQAAAQQWGVPVSECHSDLHVIVHSSSNRKAGYGELAAAAAKLPVPKKEDLHFKPRSAWRYVGKGASSYDLTDICTGKAGYGMDAHLEGMVYASVEHPPVLGGKVKSYDDKAPLQVKGVKQTIPIKPFTPPCQFQPLGGVAVIADNTWAAFQGRKKLQVAWDNGENAGYNSDPYKKYLQETARKPGKVARNIGDVDAAFAKGGKIVEADYYVPHLAHAPMEPPVALADYRDGKVTIWTSTQNPQAVQETVAGELGIPKENVICHVPLLGGGFGRKSKPDYAAEAAILSKAVGRPVKVVWSREDDIKFGYYHAVAAMYMKAALDEKGKPTAWLQRSVFPPIGSTFALNTTYGDGGDLGQGWTDLPFDIPNHRAENGPAENHVRIGWFRSVANIYHAFAAQSFADELAHTSGQDSVQYLLELIGPARIVDVKASAPDYDNYGESEKVYPLDTARMRRVVELAAEKSGWGKRKLGKGAGMGIAVHRSFLTYVATVAEVEVDEKGGVKIPAVHTAVDAGLVVNPEATRSQFEGAAVFGTSIVRSGSITAKDGVIEQSNFDNYPVARMNEAPYKTNVHIVDSDAPPAGVGEPGVPPFAPALCNAIFAATGNRIRELPLSKATATS